MIPLVHDLAGETVLVFGGGTVGARKARRFAREADVLIVAPEFADADFGGADRARAAPDPDAVPGWFDRADPALAVAATDAVAVNDAVAGVADERGVLYNRADRAGDREAGSVVVPATVRDDPVVVAVSTGGRSPALARHLRERIEDELADAGAMAELTAALRADLRGRGVPAARRREAVRAVVDSRAVWTDLGAGGSNARETAADVVADVLADGT